MQRRPTTSPAAGAAAAPDAASAPEVDDEALRVSLQELDRRASDPAAASADTVGALLAAARDLLGVTAAALMLADADRVLRCVAWTDEALRRLEQAQAEADSGPVLDAHLLGRAVASADVLVDPRWPDLHGALRELAGTDEGVGRPVVEAAGPVGGITARAVLTVPVELAGGPVGCLAVVDEAGATWGDGQTRALGAYAALVSSVLAATAVAERTSRLAEQLQHALDHRVVVDRAIGFLMARQDVDAVGAFSVLRGSARSARRKVVDVAQEVLERGGSSAAGASTGSPAPSLPNR